MPSSLGTARLENVGKIDSARYDKRLTKPKKKIRTTPIVATQEHAIMTFQIGILLVLLVLSGFFSSSETALFSLSRSKIRFLAKKKNRFDLLIKNMTFFILIFGEILPKSVATKNWVNLISRKSMN